MSPIKHSWAPEHFRFIQFNYKYEHNRLYVAMSTRYIIKKNSYETTKLLSNVFNLITRYRVEQKNTDKTRHEKV